MNALQINMLPAHSHAEPIIHMLSPYKLYRPFSLASSTVLTTNGPSLSWDSQIAWFEARQDNYGPISDVAVRKTYNIPSQCFPLRPWTLCEHAELAGRPRAVASFLCFFLFFFRSSTSERLRRMNPFRQEALDGAHRLVMTSIEDDLTRAQAWYLLKSKWMVGFDSKLSSRVRLCHNSRIYLR